MALARYRSIAEPFRSFPIHCTGIGSQRASRPCLNRRLPGYGVVVVSSGKGWFWSERQPKCSLEGPVAFWLHPGIAHSYAPDASGWSEHWVLIEGIWLEQGAADLVPSPDTPVVPITRPAALEAAMSAIRGHFVGQTTMTTAIAGADVLGLLLLLANQPPGSAKRDGHTALAEVDARLSVSEIVRRSGIPASTLRRRARQQLGTSIKAEQLRQRLDGAKELLATSALPIAAIAEASGFSDPYYFSRLFKRREGMTPSQFRQLNQR
ncbi:AraC family transcriptional regulator [uncultured Devosia sp.]|uniref:AraC family transcriptional regulator n=1 Tax=uncultured Devosia sp. TaxID=211434 RepID=UPI0035CAF8B0